MASERITGYAAGIAEIAAAENQLDRVSDEIFRVARSLESSAELSDALGDPRVPVDRKASIIDDLLGTKASPLTVSLASFLVAAGRMRDFPAIADALAERAAAIKHAAVAEVRTAVELDEATIERLTAALSRATGKQLEVKTVVDPSVLGGVVARIGDTVIDGTVRARLEALRMKLESAKG